MTTPRTSQPVKDNKSVLELSTVMSEIYESEDARAKAVRRTLAESGILLIKTKIQESETDGDISYGGYHYVLARMKNRLLLMVPSRISTLAFTTSRVPGPGNATFGTPLHYHPYLRALYRFCWCGMERPPQ